MIVFAWVYHSRSGIIPQTHRATWASRWASPWATRLRWSSARAAGPWPWRRGSAWPGPGRRGGSRASGPGRAAAARSAATGEPGPRSLSNRPRIPCNGDHPNVSADWRVGFACRGGGGEHFFVECLEFSQGRAFGFFVEASVQRKFGDFSGESLPIIHCS